MLARRHEPAVEQVTPTRTAASVQRLGRSGLAVTRYAFGGAQIGNLHEEIDEATAEDTLDAAWERGVRYFDTAPHYGLGLSERRLGRYLAGRPRKEYVISTKVGRLLKPTNDHGHELDIEHFVVPRKYDRVADYSRDGVLRSLDQSLTRLGLSKVDIVYVHDPESHYREALDGAFPALEQLRAEGVISSYGAGMNESSMLAQFVRNTDLDVIMVANRYTLLEQEPLGDLLPLCQSRGVSIVAAAIFNSGLLATDQPLSDAMYDYTQAPPETIARATRLADICKQHNVPLPAAAVQFPFGHPSVASICIGARSRAQIERNAALLDVSIPAALWEDLKHAGLLRSDAPTPG